MALLIAMSPGGYTIRDEKRLIVVPLVSVTQKMADQGWSDFHVVFTMILSGLKS